MAGGLLGQWAVGTRAAVALVAEAAAARDAGAVPARLLATAGDLVEVNAAGSPRSARASPSSWTRSSSPRGVTAG